MYEAKVLPIGAGFGNFELAVLSGCDLDSLWPLGSRNFRYRVLSFDLYAAFVLRKAGKFHFCRPHQL